jgi:ATP diphosphatase
MSAINQKYVMADLQRVMEQLRNPDTGCPWDLAQTFQSIVPSTLEECYELASAIEHEDYAHVAEELGDVLFQVIFYAQLGQEENLFSFSDIVHTLTDKLVRRHPHVFHAGQIEAQSGEQVSVDQVMQSWEAIKHSERQAKSLRGVLADVPLALPALPRAQKLQKRAASVGFDWKSTVGVFEKLEEELNELREAIKENSAPSIEDEIGDVFFTCVNLARHLGVDAEASLRRSSSKFEERFSQMESTAVDSGFALENLDEAALDILWNEAKLQILGRS